MKCYTEVYDKYVYTYLSNFILGIKSPYGVRASRDELDDVACQLDP